MAGGRISSAGEVHPPPLAGARAHVGMWSDYVGVGNFEEIFLRNLEILLKLSSETAGFLYAQ